MWYSKDINIKEIKEKLYSVGLIDTIYTARIVPDRKLFKEIRETIDKISTIVNNNNIKSIYVITGVTDWYDSTIDINSNINLESVIISRIAHYKKVVFALLDENKNTWVFHYGTTSEYSTAINDPWT